MVEAKFGKKIERLRCDNDGEYQSVCTCTCTLALCASYACAKIPNDVEELVRDIFTYLQYSFKRQSTFKEFQKFLEIKPHNILKVCQTR